MRPMQIVSMRVHLFVKLILYILAMMTVCSCFLMCFWAQCCPSSYLSADVQLLQKPQGFVKYELSTMETADLQDS